MTIALCVMLKNESGVIERLLDSCIGIINCVVVSDTGSTDNTKEIVTNWCEKNSLPLHYHHELWVDFSSNRNLLLSVAKDHAEYLLLLDADMVVSIKSEHPLDLNKTSYLLTYEGPQRYKQKLLVAGGINWKYTGVTHEYIHSEDDVSESSLDALTIKHLADGANRLTKFTRDIKLLTEEIGGDITGHSREWFYLAQSYECIGNTEAAILAYSIRAKQTDTWEEERWLSQFRASKLKLSVECLLESWGQRQHRAEPLFHIGMKYLDAKQYVLAEHFLRLASAVASAGEWRNDVLFVDRWIYDYEIKFRLAIAMWWNGKKRQAEIIFEELVNAVPDSYMESLKKNIYLCQ